MNTKSEASSLLQITDSKPKRLVLEVLRSSEVQKILKCSNSTMEKLRKTGCLPYTKVMGTLYYRIDDVIRLFNPENTDC